MLSININKTMIDLKKYSSVIKKSPYHYQIIGSHFVVNFYPTKQTYYVNGAVSKSHYNKIEDLILIANGEKEEVLSEKKHQRKELKGLKNKVKKRHKMCYICKKPFNAENKPTLEHKIPLSKGGSNREDNLVASCLECNRKKGDSLKLTN
jgi:hypothetical protein